MDRLAAMETFVRVVDAGSFSSAAKQLRIGQPGVSKSVAQLEDRLGVRLLLRSTRGLTPTEAGRKFYDRAKRSIEEADEAEHAARGAATTLSGRLRICVTSTFARLRVVHRLPAFLAQQPALDVDKCAILRAVRTESRSGPMRNATSIPASMRSISPSGRTTSMPKAYGRHRGILRGERHAANSRRSDRPPGHRLRNQRTMAGGADIDLSTGNRGDLGDFGGPRACHRGRRCSGSCVCRSGLCYRLRMDVRTRAEIWLHRRGPRRLVAARR